MVLQVPNSFGWPVFSLGVFASGEIHIWVSDAVILEGFLKKSYGFTPPVLLDLVGTYKEKDSDGSSDGYGVRLKSLRGAFPLELAEVVDASIDWRILLMSSIPLDGLSHSVVSGKGLTQKRCLLTEFRFKGICRLMMMFSCDLVREARSPSWELRGDIPVDQLGNFEIVAYMTGFIQMGGFIQVIEDLFVFAELFDERTQRKSSRFKVKDYPFGLMRIRIGIEGIPWYFQSGLFFISELEGKYSKCTLGTLGSSMVIHNILDSCPCGNLRMLNLTEIALEIVILGIRWYGVVKIRINFDEVSKLCYRFVVSNNAEVFCKWGMIYSVVMMAVLCRGMTMDHDTNLVDAHIVYSDLENGKHVMMVEDLVKDFRLRQAGSRLQRLMLCIIWKLLICGCDYHQLLEEGACYDVMEMERLIEEPFWVICDHAEDFLSQGLIHIIEATQQVRNFSTTGIQMGTNMMVDNLKVEHRVFVSLLAVIHGTMRFVEEEFGFKPKQGYRNVICCGYVDCGNPFKFNIKNGNLVLLSRGGVTYVVGICDDLRGRCLDALSKVLVLLSRIWHRPYFAILN